MVINVHDFIEALLPVGLLILYKSMKEGAVTSLNPWKYRGYKPAGGYGYKLLRYIEHVKKNTNINVKNIFEIGANFAQDADFLMECFKLSPKDVYVFEAHPEIFNAIKKIHSFNAYNNAVYNKEKEIAFHVFPLDYKNTGWSSIRGGEAPNRKKVKVQAIRMDRFMEQNNIEKIDFLKLDVEGCSYEVLEGFGRRLVDVNCIQVEAEHGIDFFPADWILFAKIEELLKSNNFELIDFDRFNGMTQSDSFWVQKSCIKYTKLW